jgi:TonB family protein
MRRILFATVLISPLLVSAAALATQPLLEVPTANRSLSTGVIPAQVLSTPRIELTPAASETMLPQAEVVLTLNVDEKGLASNVQVLKSPSHYLDGPVADAVRQFRFRPATLDNQAIPSDITLTVVVNR